MKQRLLLRIKFLKILLKLKIGFNSALNCELEMIRGVNRGCIVCRHKAKSSSLNKFFKISKTKLIKQKVGLRIMIKFSTSLDNHHPSKTNFKIKINNQISQSNTIILQAKHNKLPRIFKINKSNHNRPKKKNNLKASRLPSELRLRNQTRIQFRVRKLGISKV